MTETFENDMKVLAAHSEFAKNYSKNGFTIDDLSGNPKDLLHLFGYYDWGYAPEDDFHPKDSGCIKLEDDWMFGFRCNHLIWIDYYAVNDPKTLLIGNHKGFTDFKVVSYKI